MASQQQAGAPKGADEPGVAEPQASQAEASVPRAPRRPIQAAFGTAGGAAVVFRDYASI